MARHKRMQYDTAAHITIFEDSEAVQLHSNTEHGVKPSHVTFIEIFFSWFLIYPQKVDKILLILILILLLYVLYIFY